MVRDRLSPLKRRRKYIFVDELPRTSVGMIRKLLLRLYFRLRRVSPTVGRHVHPGNESCDDSRCPGLKVIGRWRTPYTGPASA